MKTKQNRSAPLFSPRVSTVFFCVVALAACVGTLMYYNHIRGDADVYESLNKELAGAVERREAAQDDLTKAQAEQAEAEALRAQKEQELTEAREAAS